MEGAVKGLVYLLVVVFGIASIWIGILHYKVKKLYEELASKKRAIETLQAQLTEARAVCAAEGMSDHELLNAVKEKLGRG